MYKEPSTTETTEKQEARENHEAPRSVEKSAAEIGEQMIKQSGKEVADFQQEGTSKIDRMEARAERDGLMIDSEDCEKLLGLNNEAEIAKKELGSEISSSDEFKDVLNEEVEVARERLEKKKNNLELKQLQEVAVIGYDYIREYVEQFDIQLADFSPDTIRWMSFGEGAHGKYNSNSNDIKIRQSEDSATLKTILHEQLHYAVSSKNKEGGVNFSQQRIAKTGFKSTWKSNERDGDDRDILRSLNEAVTEKIAREVFEKDKKRLPVDLEARFHETINEKRNAVIEKRLIELKELETNGVSDYNYAKEYMMDEEESLEDFINNKKAIIESQYQKGISNSTDHQRFIIDPPKSYEDEIGVLDAILEKLAEKTSSEKNISFEEALSSEWKELQKAYFNGNTLYLRKVDSAVGVGTLRLFNNLNRTMNNKEEDNDNFGNKVETLMRHIKDGK